MKLVILDRDGVINHESDAFIKSMDEWVPLPGSIDAIAALSRAGYLVCVVTNQSGLGRGLFSAIDLANMHQKMSSLVEAAGGRIDGVFYCPHLPTDNCHCRKPRPGLLESVTAEFGMPVTGAPLVGDSLKDVQLARAAGCRPMLVLTGKGKQTLAESPPLELAGVPVFPDLAAAVTNIIGE